MPQLTRDLKLQPRVRHLSWVRPSAMLTQDWVQGFGIVAPDIARYVEVLHPMPDAVQLAMRTIAERELVELLDQDTLSLLSIYAHARRPEHVLEVGTGLGEVTLQLARSVGPGCTITSIDPDALRQEQAHAFITRDEHDAAVELRLGDPMRLLRRYGDGEQRWDVVVLSDPAMDRLDLIDLVTPQMSQGALLAVPWALRGGRVADTDKALSGEDQLAEEQRTLNRRVATDPRFADVTLLTVGDGLLLARRR